MGILIDFDSIIPILENWLKTQQHLPQYIDKLVLKRFINASQGDVEKAKQLIDLNYTMRNNYPNIFLKRDPLDEETSSMLKVTDMLILPGVTRDGNKVLLYRLADIDPEKYNFNESIKVFFMVADIRFVTPDPIGVLGGEVPIFDMTGFTLRHITKIVLSTLRVYMKFSQEAHPIRLKEIHVINVPSYLDKVLTIVKPFIKSEIFKLIRFHLPGSDTLFKTVPQDILPQEYGGKAGSIEEIKKHWIDKIIQNREYIINEKYWKTDESKRRQIKTVEVNSLQGNFRTLSID